MLVVIYTLQSGTSGTKLNYRNIMYPVQDIPD